MIVENSLQSAGRVQNRPVVLLPHFLFVDHLDTYSSACFWCAVLSLQHFVEDLSDHFFRRFVACLDVFGLDSVCRHLLYPFLRVSMAVCTSSCVNSGISFFRHHCSFHLLCSFLFRICDGLALLLKVDLMHRVCCGIHQRHLPISFFDVTVSPLSFFTFEMSVLFLPDLKYDIF